ncbi:hypothetical protein C9446_02260 [Providencia heimbachae]|nr:hypothetical protein C9446_02260 [Providencia heimbachae]
MGLVRYLAGSFSIPIILQVAWVLHSLSYPNHIVYLCSSGYLCSAPTSNSNYFGYIPVIHQVAWVLLSFSYSNHRVYLYSSGYLCSAPTSNSNYFGYIPVIHQVAWVLLSFNYSNHRVYRGSRLSSLCAYKYLEEQWG